MRPICAQDGREMRIEKTGDFVEEVFADGRPYKIWAADRYRCPACGSGVLIRGAQQQPVAEHWQDDYAQSREHFAPTIQVRA